MPSLASAICINSVEANHTVRHKKMTTLAFLMNDGPMDDEPTSLIDPKDLFIALFVSAVISLVWLLVAVLMKKKGKPLKLPSSFWYIAGPGSLAIVIFIGICCFAIISSNFHKR